MKRDMDIKLVKNQCGDWEGLYIDGRLVFEGHEVRLLDLFYAVRGKLPVAFEQRETTESEEGYAIDYGRLPERLEPA